MHTKYSMKVEINKVRISFTNKKVTAYGGFSLLALFFEKIYFREAIEKIIVTSHIKLTKKLKLN